MWSSNRIYHLDFQDFFSICLVETLKIQSICSHYFSIFSHIFSGLSHGVAGHPSEFTIVTKDAGAGGLSLAIEGPSKAEIQCVDNKDGTCSVTYLPTSPGEYQIVIKFADQFIAGAPFTAKITSPSKMISYY